MTERPEDRAQEKALEREHEESTDLGYRDTEEERAYQEAVADAPEPGDEGT